MEIDVYLVSIIMPAYNAEKYISKAIDSVILQTHSNWELIIVNDGSTDRTSEVVDSYKDFRIKLINIDNCGVACARNIGLDNVNGEYVAFLDSDDYWIENKLETQLYYMLCNSNLVMTFSDYFSFYGDNMIIQNKQLYPFQISNPNDRLLVFNYIATLTVMVKASIVFELDGFDKTFFGTEDWDFWIRISKRGEFGYIDKKLAYYREHNEGISKNKRVHLIQEYKVLKKYVLKSGNNVLKKSALWFFYLKWANYYLNRKDFKKVFICYLIMIRFMPFKIENITFPLKKLFAS